MKELSVVVPTLNEESNVTDLIRRFDSACVTGSIRYQIIFIDDHSSDGTRTAIVRLASQYPVSVFLKEGERGKAQSLIEGFRRAKYPYVVMIDADLQCPPEAVPEMLEKILRGADVVVANRTKYGTNLFRRFVSGSFHLIFSRMLYGIDCDVQSGLKVFRRDVMEGIQLNPSPWTFDLEFLLSARNRGYLIEGHPVDFSERASGKSKISVPRASWEIGSHAVRLWFRHQWMNPLFTRKHGSISGSNTIIDQGVMDFSGSNLGINDQNDSRE